jgi:hypothetical protein
LEAVDNTQRDTEDPGRIPLRFRIIAIGFVIGALAHFGALVIPGFAVAVDAVSPAWRNALFTFIDLGLAWGALKRPPIMAVAMPLMFLQQLTTHGLHAWWLAREGRIDWLSLVVLAFVGYAVVVVWMDRASRKR